MAIEVQEKPNLLQPIITEIEKLTPPYLYQLRRLLDEKLKTLAPTATTSNAPRIVGTYTPKDRTPENEWVRQHCAGYEGQWVALDGNRLLAHGLNLKEVAEAAHKQGVMDALFVQIEATNALPWAGF